MLVIRDGELIEDALRGAQIGKGDLVENLKLQGFDDVRAVREGRIARNGEFSVVT